MAKEFVLMESAVLKHAKFSIKPFIRKDLPNNGLTGYNMVIHEGIAHKDYVGCIVDGRVKKYITGLNENAAEIQNLDTEKKEAKIAEIRRLVSRAERELEGNYKVPAPETKEIEKIEDFWANVTIFRSVIPDVFDNKGVRVPTYWDNLELKLDNYGIILDENDIKHLIIMQVIDAGGFSMVAPSYEYALSNSGYKFYLDKRTTTATAKVGGKRLRDKAGAKLIALADKDANKLFYITKLVTVDSLYWRTGKNATPTDTFYDECSKFIEGETVMEESKTQACETFLKYEAMKLDELKARCLIRDGKSLNYLTYKENEIFHIQTSTTIGRNDEEAALFLINPANIKIYEKIATQVEKEWS